MLSSDTEGDTSLAFEVRCRRCWELKTMWIHLAWPKDASLQSYENGGRAPKLSEISLSWVGTQNNIVKNATKKKEKQTNGIGPSRTTTTNKTVKKCMKATKSIKIHSWISVQISGNRYPSHSIPILVHLLTIQGASSGIESTAFLIVAAFGFNDQMVALTKKPLDFHGFSGRKKMHKMC